MTNAHSLIRAGMDIGNGYVKSNIEGQVLAFPSVTVKRYNIADHAPLADEELPSFMKNITNEMDLSFSSPLVQTTERRLFGDRAMKSGEVFEEFDVFSRASKASVDLSGIMALATIAADRLDAYYHQHNGLPASRTITTNVDFATALPIGEHKKNHKGYKDRYLNKGNAHIVTVHNFEEPIRVEITFDNVYVANEGESAQYGLRFANDAFLNVLQEAAAKRFPNGELNDVTGKDLVGAENTLGIDIGEGTIDFAVFTQNKFNTDASSTMNRGYGTVLEETLTVLQNEGYPYNSRKELSEFLNSTPSKFSRQKWNHVAEVNRSEENRFSESVAAEVSKVFDRVGGFTEVIFVYGGGATPLEWALFNKLQSRVSEFGTENLLPIVYLDSNYSRYLNVQGLFEVAKRLRPEAPKAVKKPGAKAATGSK